MRRALVGVAVAGLVGAAAVGAGPRHASAANSCPAGSVCTWTDAAYSAGYREIKPAQFYKADGTSACIAGAFKAIHNASAKVVQVFSNYYDTNTTCAAGEPSDGTYTVQPGVSQANAGQSLEVHK